MKSRLLTLVITCLLSQFILGQNVGIGTLAPGQMLDVNGNINTAGNLMVNGVAGTHGQVLTMNGSSMQWMDKSRFKNWATYQAAGSATFTVPAGVTEVMIEMWAGGGGGHNPGGGGGSGGYWIGLIPVNGIPTISLTIGAGGALGSSSTPGSQGGNTGFSCTGFNVSAEGGFGADTALNGTFENYIGGRGGLGMHPTGLLLPAGFRNYYFITGNFGTPTLVEFVQVNATVFSKKFIGGVGGTAPFSGQIPRPNQSRIENAGGANYVFQSAGLSDFSMGGNCAPFAVSSAGGAGRIIIYY